MEDISIAISLNDRDTLHQVNKPEHDLGSATNELSVSVVVCTRNRGALIVDCVQAILASKCEFGELIVVDQSTDDLSAKSLASLQADSRLVYIKSETVGTGISRNIGISVAASDIVAFTDDDCIVQSDWLDAHVKAFRDYKNVILTYGAVNAADHNPDLGYIPIYTIEADRVVSTISDKTSSRGIGANSAIRRREIVEIGAYDPLFGPGSYLQSGEDVDLTIRVILQGHAICECKNSIVTHFGFRSWEAGRVHSSRDMIAIGAACAKPLKIGRWDAWCITTAEIGTYTLMPLARAWVRLRKPYGWRRFTSFLKGFWMGWKLDVEPETLRYVRPTDSAHHK